MHAIRWYRFARFYGNRRYALRSAFKLAREPFPKGDVK